MEAAAKKTILRIELWHVAMLLALLVTLAPGSSLNQKDYSSGPVHGH
jgi:hypothetical protein